MTPPHVVYHVAGMGNWKEVVDEQLTLLRESGLAEADIRITYLGNECGWLEGRLKDFGMRAEIIFNDTNLDHCETLAMQEVEKIAKKENSENPILYFHTKGVSSPGDWGKKRWRNLMQEHVIRQWRVNLHHLMDYDAVGVNWHEGGTQHFSGTFWIANPSWIRRLRPFVEYHHDKGSHRYTCEMWIGSTEWCHAKSLGCRNEPFWNAWFDFDRFLPPKVPGHFDYRGTPAQQTPKILEVFPQLLKELNPARILEIGTGQGGFIRFVRNTLKTLGRVDVPTLSVDPVPDEHHLTVKKEGSTILTLQPFDHAYKKVEASIAKYVNEPGKTLIFCDGGTPSKEFGALADIAKVGDVICVHDYAPTLDVFKSKLHCKVWDWLETTYDMISKTVNKYEMTPWEEERLQSVAWGGYTKMTSGEKPIVAANVVKDRIGLGVLTYKRPEYFAQSIRTVRKVLNALDVVHVYNDGSTGSDYFPIYAVLPDKIRVCHADKNRGVSYGKNHLLKTLLDAGCEYIFIMEDDILIRDHRVFRKYIDAHVPGSLEHLNFAHHGPANDAGKIDGYSEVVDLFPNVVGAFSFYTANCLHKAGLMDEGFKNCWEHVEHTARIADMGLTTPFWRFADIVDSKDYLEEIPGSIDGSSIRDDKKWKENIEAGLEHWKKDLQTPCPL